MRLLRSGQLNYKKIIPFPVSFTVWSGLRYILRCIMPSRKWPIWIWGSWGITEKNLPPRSEASWTGAGRTVFIVPGGPWTLQSCSGTWNISEWTILFPSRCFIMIFRNCTRCFIKTEWSHLWMRRWRRWGFWRSGPFTELWTMPIIPARYSPAWWRR